MGDDTGENSDAYSHDEADHSDDEFAGSVTDSDADCDARLSAEGGGIAGDPGVRFEVPEPLHAESVDREHRICARRLNALARLRNAHTLARAIAALSDHFAHEERLLRTGAVADRAIAAHAADHAAIISLARAELRRCRGQASAFGPEPAVRREFLAALAERFAFHTREYDARCAAALRVAVGTGPSSAGDGGGP